ncbi:MAG: hypothetical protein E7391_05430 [Ruminococcaceae bacterium]|nr:hypothetical protein [Oscillospiraceae bacterium]
MKKILCLLLTVCMSFGMITISYAKTGDVLGYAKYTDISAYINHYPITSYNLNGNTVVIAEDLANYGFNVRWNQSNRTLTINRSYTKNISGVGKVYKYESKLGQNSMPYLETDIKTYVNGNLVASYNVDGKTVINIEDLKVFGEVVWVPEIRAIKMWISDLHQTTYRKLDDISILNKPSINYDDFMDLTEWIKLGMNGESLCLKSMTNFTKYNDNTYRDLFDRSKKSAVESYEEAYNIAIKYNNTQDIAYYIKEIMNNLNLMSGSGVTRLDSNNYLKKFKNDIEISGKIIKALENLVY